jgi:hypothetical protein
MVSSAQDGRRFSAAGAGQVRGLAPGVVGPARVIAFGASNVAPAGAVVAGLIIVVAYAGFASPLVVLIAFVASLCCASSIAEFRSEFRFWRHLLVPAVAALLFLFPLWGLLHPRTHQLMDLLPFAALGWLLLGAIAAGILRVRRPARFEALGRVFAPATQSPPDG